MAPLPVFRLDSDVAAAAGVATVLRRFEAAPAGVLVGTQMVAKGHDFPDVTLGVVLDADATLRFPDFRAEERTFALVAQLAGRSGRGERGGRVIVQALDPSAEALRFAAAPRLRGVPRGELRRRELLSYPPHGHLIRVVCSSVEPGPEVEAATAIRELDDCGRRAGTGSGAAVPPPGRATAHSSWFAPGAGAGDRRGTRGGRAGGGGARARRGEFRGGCRSAVARQPVTPALGRVKLGPDGRGSAADGRRTAEQRGERTRPRPLSARPRRFRSSTPRPRRGGWPPCRSSAVSVTRC